MGDTYNCCKCQTTLNLPEGIKNCRRCGVKRNFESFEVERFMKKTKKIEKRVFKTCHKCRNNDLIMRKKIKDRKA